ncbi:MAG: hypothetical protein KatS3mg111_2642 [Pirellulaceae bacterium]|nr:MAG: hypothetical protein KatS3mg111_2642 [Pirellulaceae bacterium]
MVQKPPPYFARVRAAAHKRWQQLDSDPELAAPWQQLFMQVQSPRHVLSELLQNADDAGATEVRVQIDHGIFTFSHNGADFTEEHFESLCRFGYSNKRTLHTIGFRGVGFKSVFSLGDRVSVQTPSLSVYFDRHRFTLPHWLEDDAPSNGQTTIRVKIRDRHRQQEIERNLSDWQRSPFALLFFRSIRSLEIGPDRITWRRLGKGPVPDSHWMELVGISQTPYLLVRSREKAFPAEALQEIREERMLSEEETVTFPPCRVDIVLRAEGRLFVVLPTEIETGLPFACNAPFIQDPARMKIKDPESSPTNQWLLKRCGVLAAQAMLSWLANKHISEEERAVAYQWLPSIKKSVFSSAALPSELVAGAFNTRIEGKPFVLTDSGELRKSGEVVCIPNEIHGIWPSSEASMYFDAKNRALLSPHVATGHRTLLVERGAVEKIESRSVLDVLADLRLPCPDTWEKLFSLWKFVASEVDRWWREDTPRKLRIVPAAAKSKLYSSLEVVVLPKKPLLKNEDDWQFLIQDLQFVDSDWLEFVDRTLKTNAPNDNRHSRRDWRENFVNFVESLDLTKAASATKLISNAAISLQHRSETSIEDWIHLAHLAAEMDAQVDDNFRYVTRNGTIRTLNDCIFAGESDEVQSLVPDSLRDAVFLHPDYFDTVKPSMAKVWQGWIASSKAKLKWFPPIVQKRYSFWSEASVTKEVKTREGTMPAVLRYRNMEFRLEDWDFPDEYWTHWAEMAEGSDGVWAAVLERVLKQSTAYWNNRRFPRVIQVSQQGTEARVETGPLTPQWILRLRDKPCLRDTNGHLRKPSDLLVRTKETEALIDVELFVHHDLDTEATRPILVALGVGTKPTDANRIIDCLRTLAQSKTPPIHEVERWYRRLDQMASACSTETLKQIIEAFQLERLILTDTQTWETTDSVFKEPDTLVDPDAAVIRDSVRNLTLWSKIEVAERPTAELALKWLTNLPRESKLEPETICRIRELLKRYAEKVWQECGAWLDLAGRWVPADKLKYSISMQALSRCGGLFESIKHQTADMQMLSSETAGNPVFSRLQPLTQCIDYRVNALSTGMQPDEIPPWARAFGTTLARVVLDDESATESIRKQAVRLSRTRWCVVPELDLMPYIDGTPAGASMPADVCWSDEVLYVRDLPHAKLAKLIPEELASPFGRPDIRDALHYSYDRNPEKVTAYLAQNFELDETAQSETSRSDSETGAEEGGSKSVRTDVEADTNEQLDDAQTVDGFSGDAEDSFHAVLEGDHEVQTESDNDEHPARTTRPKLGANPEQSLMERFALACGFRKEMDGRYVHEDGRRLSKTTASSFPWEEISRDGEVTRFYLPREHCLERRPMEIEMERWELLRKHPNKYALILVSSDGRPVEFAGHELHRLVETEKIKVLPASYRLVWEHDE